MEKFETVFRGFDKKQVIEWLDQYIKEYDKLLEKSKLLETEKQTLEAEKLQLEDKLKSYERVEATLNRALFAAESAGDQIKRSARIESESLTNDAKKNASRIINDALLKAEKIEISADNMKRNVIIFKRRLKAIIESQMEVVDEIDNLDLKSVDRDNI